MTVNPCSKRLLICVCWTRSCTAFILQLLQEDNSIVTIISSGIMFFHFSLSDDDIDSIILMIKTSNRSFLLHLSVSLRKCVSYIRCTSKWCLLWIISPSVISGNTESFPRGIYCSNFLVINVKEIQENIVMTVTGDGRYVMAGRVEIKSHERKWLVEVNAS